MSSNKKQLKNGSKTPDINNNSKINNIKNSNNKNKIVFPKIDDNKTNTSFRRKVDISTITHISNIFSIKIIYI